MEASHFTKSAGYSHLSPADSSSWSLLLSMNPNKSFIWVSPSPKLLSFPSLSVCLRPAGAMLGFPAFLQESQRGSAQQTGTHWNHTDLPSCNWGSSSYTAQPASVGDLLNKYAELDNFLYKWPSFTCGKHKHQFTDRSSTGTAAALSVPGEPERDSCTGWHKKSAAGTWACLILGSTSEFKDEINDINSFMYVSFERLGYKEHKAIQERKKRVKNMSVWCLK